VSWVRAGAVQGVAAQVGLPALLQQGRRGGGGGDEHTCVRVCVFVI